MPETKAPRPLCRICAKPIDVQTFPNGETWAGGHNAEPIATGRCCTLCNDTVVIPARFRAFNKSRSA